MTDIKKKVEKVIKPDQHHDHSSTLVIRIDGKHDIHHEDEHHWVK